MKISTALISYNRPEFLYATILSYTATVTGEHDLVIVDNGSGPETRELLDDYERAGVGVIRLRQNVYPGPAANRGFDHLARYGAEILHRSDNDMTYLPGWADTLRETFDRCPEWVQVSLRTNEEEQNEEAVGGNMAVRSLVWADGIRYTSKGWARVPWEDGTLSFAIQKRYGPSCWGRVPRPCVVHAGAVHAGLVDDPYTVETYRVRGISDVLDDLRG